MFFFAVLISLYKHYEEAIRRDDVKAIVLTGIALTACAYFTVLKGKKKIIFIVLALTHCIIKFSLNS